jgi:hypothetical protein
MKKWIALFLAFSVGVTTAAQSSPTVPAAHGAGSQGTSQRPKLPLTSKTLFNTAAYIPPQCYTKTRDKQGRVHNPCFTCHTTPRRPNYTGDVDLQRAYDFAETPSTNHWTNLFRDRSQAVAGISDADIRDYIRRSNYFDEQGRIKLATRLANVPREWDYNGNGQWDGFVPDAWFDFDAQGFDRDPEGHYTGWRAFAYYPFPGTFWPTNGSTDDVLIRLPETFRTRLDGKYDITVYKTNLAIVEAVLKEQDVFIDPVNEAALGNVDLDKDGKIGTANRITYDWAPLDQRYMWYVGTANALQKAGKVHLAAGLYPEGTEFLHTVRYIDVNAAGDNLLAPRMKEVRYALKRFWMNYSKLRQKAAGEFKEKHDFPNRLRTVRGNMEAGVSNGQAWAYAGFVEDATGELRPQSYEELVFCVGCHGGIGGNRDGIFSFDRKFDHDTYRQGWYHWTQKNLKATPERLRSDGKYEYSYYLELNGAGDEFRENDEILRRFFASDGKPDPAELRRLRTDISLLLFASERRAMTLNKAYRTIVREQRFVEGRDATVKPVGNVHEKIEPGTSTGVERAVLGY